ncbi:MAG: hypothetical protein M1284_01005 [Candidatus Parvarchaeota archaeon]|jgi:hypothetical protein|nr:hypothetical protein [Candidatus Parvarchaeota archaeon]
MKVINILQAATDESADFLKKKRMALKENKFVPPNAKSGSGQWYPNEAEQEAKVHILRYGECWSAGKNPYTSR